jgi:hypothetical protein
MMMEFTARAGPLRAFRLRLPSPGPGFKSYPDRLVRCCDLCCPPCHEFFLDRYPVKKALFIRFNKLSCIRLCVEFRANPGRCHGDLLLDECDVRRGVVLKIGTSAMRFCARPRTAFGTREALVESTEFEIER